MTQADILAQAAHAVLCLAILGCFFLAGMAFARQRDVRRQQRRDMNDET